MTLGWPVLALAKTPVALVVVGALAAFCIFGGRELSAIFHGTIAMIVLSPLAYWLGGVPMLALFLLLYAPMWVIGVWREWRNDYY
jgi:hypothetical protein